MQGLRGIGSSYNRMQGLKDLQKRCCIFLLTGARNKRLPLQDYIKKEQKTVAVIFAKHFFEQIR